VSRNRFPLLVTLGVLVFFYLPIAVLVAQSFNASRYGGHWEGFTFAWYAKLFHEREIWRALRNSLLIASTVTLASVVLGTTAAFALHRWQGRLQQVHYMLVYSPLVVPDILMGMSLLMLFVSLGVRLGLGTIFLAQATFCVSYVAMVVLARLQDFDYTVVEAAQDLGADWWTVARRVLLPLLAPGIAAGALLAFTISIDDFVITFFVAGPGSTTLPLRIYSMIKFGSPPLINALSTIILALTFVAVAVSQRLAAGKEAPARPSNHPG
jgi:spermidine/putrescine transport system permease protein